jgi:hypothetical protein
MSTLAEVRLDALQRAERLVKLYLLDDLAALNARFGWTQDRALRLPLRIVLGAAPALRLEELSPGQPQLFLKMSAGSNPRVDLVGHEDQIANIEISVVMTGVGRTAGDLAQRTETLATAVVDLLQARLPYGCSSTSWGVWRCSALTQGSPRVQILGDTMLVRSDATVEVSIRYESARGSTFLPEFSSPDTHLPTNAAPSLQAGSVTIQPYTLTAISGAITVPTGATGRAFQDSGVEISITGSSVTLPTGLWSILMNFANGVNAAYRVEVSP